MLGTKGADDFANLINLCFIRRLLYVWTAESKAIKLNALTSWSCRQPPKNLTRWTGKLNIFQKNLPLQIYSICWRCLAHLRLNCYWLNFNQNNEDIRRIFRENGTAIKKKGVWTELIHLINECESTVIILYFCVSLARRGQWVILKKIYEVLRK